MLYITAAGAMLLGCPRARRQRNLHGRPLKPPTGGGNGLVTPETARALALIHRQISAWALAARITSEATPGQSLVWWVAAWSDHS